MEQVKHSIGHTLYALGAFLLLFSVTLLQPVNIIYAKAINSTAIIEKTNETRQRLNKTPLNVNRQLMSAAQAKAEDMANKKYFAHYGPNGETPWQFFADAEYSYQTAGENLAITNEDEDRVIEGWLDSPTHRENLLSSEYYDIGIGVAYFGDYENHKSTTVVVAFYGQSKPPLLVTGTEPTAPAGTVAALQGSSIIGLNPGIIIALASALIIAGLALEIRHIRRTHHSHHPSY